MQTKQRGVSAELIRNLINNEVAKHGLIKNLLFSLLILFSGMTLAYESWDVRPYKWAVQNDTNVTIIGVFAAFNKVSTVSYLNWYSGDFHRAAFSLGDGIAPGETKISPEDGMPAPFAPDHWCIEFTSNISDRRAWIDLTDQVCNLSNEDVSGSSTATPVKIVISGEDGNFKVDVIRPNGEKACPTFLTPRPLYFKGCVE